MQEDSQAKYLTLSTLVHGALAWSIVQLALVSGSQTTGQTTDLSFEVVESSVAIAPKKQPVLAEKKQISRPKTREVRPLPQPNPVEVDKEVEIAKKPEKVDLKPEPKTRSEVKSVAVPVPKAAPRQQQNPKLIPPPKEQANAEASSEEKVLPVESSLKELTPPVQTSTAASSQISPQGQRLSQSPRPGSALGMRTYQDLRQLPGNPTPQYPTSSRLRREQGNVMIKYFVTAGGAVSQVQLVRSSGYPLLDQEALQAASRYKFVPGQAGWTLHPVSFVLTGQDEVVGGRLRTSLNTYQ